MNGRLKSLLRVVVATTLVIWLSATIAVHREVSVLHRRVDSMATSLGALIAVQNRGRPPRATPESLSVIADGGVVLGSSGADVAIVEFSDYQCPFCAKHAKEVWPQLRAEFIGPGKAQYIVRDLPLPMHAEARHAAIAARCVHSLAPTALSRFRDSLFANQRALSEESVGALGMAVTGLSRSRWLTCISDKRYAESVDLDVALARRLGVARTPTFIVGSIDAGGEVRGAVLEGLHDIGDFRSHLRRALEKGSQQR